MRLHMCQVYVCTAQEVVLCVGQASLPVSCCVCFVAGALRRSHAEGRQPPNPKGWILTQSPHQALGPTSWALVQRESRTVRPISRIPWSAADSRLSIYSRDSVDRAASAASSRKRVSGESTTADSLKAASLNASAARESTTTGGLEAFSQSSAGVERFENASSKFRWNPSPLLSLK